MDVYIYIYIYSIHVCRPICVYIYQLYYINAVAGSKEESMGRKNNRGRLDRWVINKKRQGFTTCKSQARGVHRGHQNTTAREMMQKKMQVFRCFPGNCGTWCRHSIQWKTLLSNNRYSRWAWWWNPCAFDMDPQISRCDACFHPRRWWRCPGGFFNGGWIPTMKERKQIQWNEQLRLAKIKIRRNKWQETNENTWKPGAWRCIRRRKTIQSEGIRFRNTIQKLRKDVGRAVRSLKELPIQQLLNPQ